MNGNWGLIAGVAAFLVSIITIVSVLIAIGQYKGKTDQKIDGMKEGLKDLSDDLDDLEKEEQEDITSLKNDFQKEISGLRKDLVVSTNATQAFEKKFAEFSGEMRATMQYIQSDLKDIKEKFNAKEK